MQNIYLSNKSVSILKKSAKSLVRDSHQTHIQTLNILAQRFGLNSWSDVIKGNDAFNNDYNLFLLHNDEISLTKLRNFHLVDLEGKEICNTIKSGLLPSTLNCNTVFELLNSGHYFFLKLNPNYQIANDNKANMLNPNKGTNGTNDQYDKAQGNRGKQLNPNRGQKLIIPITKKSWIVTGIYNDIGHDTYETFEEGYINKGYLNKIGAEILDESVVAKKDLRIPNWSKSPVNIEHYIFIEYRENIHNGKEDVYKWLSRDFNDDLFEIYGAFFWLDGKAYWHDNHGDNEVPEDFGGYTY
ncbi:hypothetical protein [Marinicellulosiphila megalodicopiae]|uniref:hypothetical protein n=1 Tax=Marinicellulosiphila megalodicopiae TaxID=2724896 RepID=UPI003BAF63F4